MRKSDLLVLFGTLQGIADIFKPPLTKGAISQWPDDDDIPELREYQIRELIPDIDKRIERAKRQRAAA